MHLSYTEENYLKAIYLLSLKKTDGVSTNDIAEEMQTKASSATDMIKKLYKKHMLDYKAYQPVQITNTGKNTAIKVIRKHRLWETFLVDKLGFEWHEVHEIAEELEHIKSEKLITKLDHFLGHPTHDPHGDPIPDRAGNIKHHSDFTVADLRENQFGMIIGLKDTSPDFLKFLDETGLTLGRSVRITKFNEYDQSMQIVIDMKKQLSISHRVAKNLYIKKLTR